MRARAIAARTAALPRQATVGIASASRRGIAASVENARELGDSLQWIFGGWQRLVTRISTFLRPRRRFAAARETLVDAAGILQRPASFGALSAPRADHVAALGIRLFIAGSVAGVILGWVTQGSPGSALAAGLSSWLWAGARLAILIALAPRDRRRRVATYGAWSVSLLPYLLGLTEGLRLIALVGSAVICLEALRGAGIRTSTARMMTLWAFGGQAGISVAGWLFRGGLAVLGSL